MSLSSLKSPSLQSSLTAAKSQFGALLSDQKWWLSKTGHFQRGQCRTDQGFSRTESDALRQKHLRGFAWLISDLFSVFWRMTNSILREMGNSAANRPATILNGTVTGLKKTQILFHYFRKCKVAPPRLSRLLRWF